MRFSQLADSISVQKTALSANKSLLGAKTMNNSEQFVSTNSTVK